MIEYLATSRASDKENEKNLTSSPEGLYDYYCLLL